MDALVHSIAGWLWLIAWFFVALAFITSKRHTRNLVSWIERVSETGLRFGRRGDKVGLLLCVAVFASLAFFVCVFLLFLTPVLMVACLLGTRRGGWRR